LSELEVSINDPVSKFVQKPIFVLANESVKNAARLMSEKKLGAVIVTTNDEALGIVTEWDILTRVVAQGKDSTKTTVRDVMSSPVLTISSNLTVGEAIKLMSRNKYRRLLVKEGSKTLGLITLSQVVGSTKESTITLPLLEPPSGMRCPYCGSILKDRDELSLHIDRVHVREEILRGAHGPIP
jgi:CBS domain-containing protein